MFVGLDANYSEHIDKRPIFPRVVEYLDDGVAFWTNNGVNHPFLLKEYKGGGKFYHRTFAQIRFQTEDASDQADDIGRYRKLLEVGGATLVIGALLAHSLQLRARRGR